jgi:hypothetical protein
LKYPFHRLPPVQAKKVQGTYHLLLFRCPDTGEVIFLQLNPTFIWVVDCLSKNMVSTQNVIDLLIETLGDQLENLETFANKIEDFILDLYDRKMIRGFVLNQKLEENV